jgi:hypothetical protein
MEATGDPGPVLVVRRRGIRSVLLGSALILIWASVGATGVGAKPNAAGNNGTLKVHEDQEPRPEIRNQPHVCTFHLHGFHFDDNSTGGWHIDKHAPTGSGEVRNGNWSADGVGTWRTAQMTLPPGHYKAYAKQMNPSTPGGWKQKVFWVECEQAGGNTGEENGGNGGNGGENNSGGSAPTPAPTGGTKPATSVNGSNGNELGAGGVGPGATLPPTSTDDSQPANGQGSIWLVLIGFVLMAAGVVVLRPGQQKVHA